MARDPFDCVCGDDDDDGEPPAERRPPIDRRAFLAPVRSWEEVAAAMTARGHPCSMRAVQVMGGVALLKFRRAMLADPIALRLMRQLGYPVDDPEPTRRTATHADRPKPNRAARRRRR